MKVLNLLTSGRAGGIESLCRDIGVNSDFENGFCFLFGDGAIYQQMKDMGLKTYCLSKIGKKISLKRFLELRNIAKEYDIIVVHHGDPFLKAYHYSLMKTLKKKYVTVIHSCYEKEYFYPDNVLKRQFAHFIFQIGLSNSDLNVFVSKAGMKSYEKEFKIIKKKETVVYNGIGMDKLNAGKKWLPRNEEPFNVMYIGRLEKGKGVDLLLKAVSEIKNSYSIKLSIVGDGTERKKIEELSKDLGIGSITTFYGQQKDVIPFLKQADIFVYPSVWQEVFGISIVEAMAFGIPCISNNVGGIPEIIENEKSGFICESATCKELERKLDEVLKRIKNNKIINISEKAKERAAQFSIKNTVDNLNIEYSTLMKKGV